MSNNPEALVLMRLSYDLLKAIHHPISLAHQLFSCGIITDEVISMCNGNKSNYEKVSYILEAVRGQVHVDGRESFVKFVRALNNEPAMRPIVDKLWRTYKELGGELPLSELREGGACGTGPSMVERRYECNPTASTSTFSAAKSTSSVPSDTSSFQIPLESFDELSEASFPPPAYEEHITYETLMAAEEPQPQALHEANESSVFVYGGTDPQTPFLLSSDGSLRSLHRPPLRALSLPTLTLNQRQPTSLATINSPKHSSDTQRPNGKVTRSYDPACYHRSLSECVQTVHTTSPGPESHQNPESSSAFPPEPSSSEAAMCTNDRPRRTGISYMYHKAKGVARGTAKVVKNVFSGKKSQQSHSNSVDYGVALGDDCSATVPPLWQEGEGHLATFTHQVSLDSLYAESEIDHCDLPSLDTMTVDI